MPLGDEALRAAMVARGLDAGGRSACSPSSPARATRRPGSTSCSPATSGCPPTSSACTSGHMGCYAALPGLAIGRRRGRGPRQDRGDAVHRADLAARPAGRGGLRADGGPRALRRRRRRGDGASGRPATAAGPRGRRRRRARTDVAKSRADDLGRHRPRLPHGPVPEGARRSCASTSARGRGPPGEPRPATGGRRGLGRASRRARASSRSVDEAARALRRAGRRVRRASCATTATARRPPSCSSSSGCWPPSASPPGDHVVAMAFGPGLTLYMTLLRVTSTGGHRSR